MASTEELRKQVESLAMEAVLGEAGAIASSLARIQESAERAGAKAAAEIASELIALSPAGDPAVLQSGIERLEQALDEQKPATTSLAQDPELLGDFVMESREHLGTIEAQLLVLEQDTANSEAIHAIFRGFHSIKGLAGFLDLAVIQEVSHEVETVLDKARNGQLGITPTVIDAVLASADYLSRAISQVEAMLAGQPPPAVPDSQPLVNRVRSLLASEAPASACQASGSEEPVGPSSSSTQARAVRVDTAKLDYLVDMVGEMVIAQSLVRHDPELDALKNTRLVKNLSRLSRITTDVQKTAMTMRMVPIGQLFKRMSRLVRDLSRKHGKQVELEIQGEETELDRNIVEELADPLMHMIRNAVDHGVETAAQREAAGKSPVAQVRLRAFHRAGHIVIEVSDDGKGIEREKVLRKAREKGLIEDGAHLKDAEVFNFIFQPGFSTADQVTDVSGRGVGMDVVRRQIQKLKGRIDVQSVPGKGTTFYLKVPLTLAIIDGLVVAVAKRKFIIPLSGVKEMIRPAPGMITTVQGRSEAALIRGKLLPVVRLASRFSLKACQDDLSQSLLIVVEGEEKCFCLAVDDFIGKQEVVIKSLGEGLKHIPGIAGGAILGDGRVALIVDIDGVFSSSTSRAATVRERIAACL